MTYENEFFELNLPDGPARCSLRRSSRARSMRIRILPGPKIEVVLPYGLNVRNAIEFAERQKAWIERTLRDLAQTPPPVSEARSFPDELPLDWFGGPFRVEYEWRPVRWIAAKLEPEERVVRISGNLFHPGAIFLAVGDLLKRNTERFIFPRLRELAQTFGFNPGKLSVRIQKGRWGSCSSRGGAISLNALLLFQPQELVDYVLIHELCHLRHMNHSDAFWKEVAKFCPDFAAKRAE